MERPSNWLGSTTPINKEMLYNTTAEPPQRQHHHCQGIKQANNNQTQTKRETNPWKNCEKLLRKMQTNDLWAKVVAKNDGKHQTNSRFQAYFAGKTRENANI